MIGAITLNEIINKYANKYGIPAALIRAIIQVESSRDNYAIRHEPHYQWLYRPEYYAKKHFVTVSTEIIAQKISWGPMQVMGAVARELGFDGRFLSELTNPELGIKYGCKHLKNFYNKYGNWTDAIAAYNAGSPRKREDGRYMNQSYVDYVLENWR